MERRMHLVETAEEGRLEWPSIAAASIELRRPRHLRAVPPTEQSSGSASRENRLRLVSRLDPRRR